MKPWDPFEDFVCMELFARINEAQFREHLSNLKFPMPLNDVLLSYCEHNSYEYTKWADHYYLELQEAEANSKVSLEREST